MSATTHDNAIIDFLPGDIYGAEWDAQYLVDDNSNFEGGTTGNWAVHTNASSPISSLTSVFTGTKCMSFLSAAAGDAKIATSSGGVFLGLGRITAARVYTARAFFLPSTITRNCRIDIEWYNAASALVSTTAGTAVSCTAGVYTKYEGNHTAPATAVKIRAVAVFVGTAGVETVRVDNVQVEDRHIDITTLVREVAYNYGRTYITDQFETGTLNLTCNTMSGEFDSDYMGTTTAITYVGAGAASIANNAATSPTIHASTTVNDFMFMFDMVTSSGTPGNVTIPTGWNLIAQFNRDGAGSPRIALLYRYFQTGDTTPSVGYTGPTANDAHITHIATFRNVHLTDPINVMSVPSSNAAALNIGPVAGLQTSYNGGAVIALAARADDWTSVATLSGDSLTWAEIGEPFTTVLDDAGLVWDYALIPTAPQIITSKTFTVTGGSGTAVGMMVALKPISSVANAYAGSGKFHVQTQVRVRIQAPAVGTNARRIYPGAIGNIESVVQDWDIGDQATTVQVQCADLLRILQNGSISWNIEDLIQNESPLIHLPLMEVQGLNVDPLNKGVDSGFTPVWGNRKAGMIGRVTGLMRNPTVDMGTTFNGANSAKAFEDLEHGCLYFGDTIPDTSNAIAQTAYLDNWTIGFWFKAGSNIGTSVQEPAMITFPHVQFTLRSSAGAGAAYNQLRMWYMNPGHTASTAATITAGTNYFFCVTKNTLGFRTYLGTATSAPTVQATFGPTGSLISYPWDATTHTWGINVGWNLPFTTTSQSRFDMTQFFMVPRSITPTQIEAVWKDSSIMYPEEDTGSRLTTTVLNSTNIPTGRRKISVGKTTVASTRRESGTSLLEYAQSLNTTELGLLYCNGEGVLVFNNRDYLPLLNTISITLGENIGAGEIPYTADFHPSLDIEKVFTRVVINRDVFILSDNGEGSSESLTFQKDASNTLQTRYGIRAFSQLNWSSNPYECDDIAQYLLNVLSMTARRVSTVTVIPDRNAQWAQIMERKIGDKILVRRRPKYFAAGYARVYQIESISAQVKPGATTPVTWSLSPVWLPSGFLPDGPDSLGGPIYWVLGTNLLGTNTYLGY